MFVGLDSPHEYYSYLRTIVSTIVICVPLTLTLCVAGQL